jgi:putative SOS response-associated peptidase YedK
MCYINGVKVSLKEYIAYKQKQKELKHLNQLKILNQPAKRGFDYSDWPIIKPYADGKDWEPVAMEWGFIPSWVTTREDVEKFRKGYKDASGKFQIGYTTLNAMGEEILNKKMFHEAALTRRCLVLSSGFYEHRHLPKMGKKGQVLKATEKYPYHITVKDADDFLIAGIYNTFIDRQTGETKDTFAILTTSALDHKIMSQVHNSKMRMPTILTDELANKWTEPDLSEKEIIELATFQYPSEKMKAHPVRKDFLQYEDPETEFIYETDLSLVA